MFAYRNLTSTFASLMVIISWSFFGVLSPLPVQVEQLASPLSASGDLPWAKSMGGGSSDRGHAIAVDGSGNVYTTGDFQGTADFDPGTGIANLTSVGENSDIFVSKLDGDGNFVWARGMGGASYDDGLAIAVDASGNVYTTGTFEGIADFDPGMGTVYLTGAGHQDIFISKLDSSGNFVWAKSMGGSSLDSGIAIMVDASGNVYTTGDFQGTADFDPGTGIANLTSVGQDIFISKLDSNGNFIWAKGMRGTDSVIGNAIALDGNGNVYTTGGFWSIADFDPGVGISNLTSTGQQDIFISKLDSSGNFVWARGMGGGYIDYGRAIALDGSGNVYTTGSFQGTADFNPGTGVYNLTSAQPGIFISKLDSSGNFVWAKGMGGTDGGGLGAAIALDGSGNVYTTGWFSGTVDFDPGAGTANLISHGYYSDIFVSKLENDATMPDTTGVFRPSNGLLYLKNANTTGFADIAINYGLGGDYPVVGDWDGNGTDTIGIYRNGSFYLRNSNTIGFAEIVFPLGTPGDQPIAGDWDGDGVDTIGVYRPSTGQFLLRNSNSTGTVDMSFYLGNVGDVGIAGDWDGDGKDTTGVFRPSNGIIFLKTTNISGFADIALNYGLAGDQPVTGDWNGDGIDTIGVYRKGTFYLRNENTNGFAEIVFGLGNPGDMPIAGNWDGQP